MTSKSETKSGAVRFFTVVGGKVVETTVESFAKTAEKTRVGGEC